MKLSKKLTPIAAGSALLLSGMAAPIAAQAEAGMSADVSVANMYLWRGLDVSGGKPQVSGSLGWDSGAGFYVNSWVTNGYSSANGLDGTPGADAFSGYEVDVWAGYAGEVSGLSYDVSLWEIMYPESDASGSGGSATGLHGGKEISLGLGYMGVSFSYTVNSGERYPGDDDYSYMTLGYSYGDFGITYGTQQFDKTQNADWSHINLSYSLGENASVTISKASQDAVGAEEDPLIVFSYTLPIDLSKK
jgi:uncharacterized protein (TIGR02001 family)